MKEAMQLSIDTPTVRFSAGWTFRTSIVSTDFAAGDLLASDPRVVAIGLDIIVAAARAEDVLEVEE